MDDDEAGQSPLINCIYAWLVTQPDGSEGIVAQQMMIDGHGLSEASTCNSRWPPNHKTHAVEVGAADKSLMRAMHARFQDTHDPS